VPEPSSLLPDLVPQPTPPAQGWAPEPPAGGVPLPEIGGSGRDWAAPAQANPHPIVGAGEA